MKACSACGQPLRCASCQQLQGEPDVKRRAHEKLLPCFIYEMIHGSRWPEGREFLISKGKLAAIMRNVIRGAGTAPKGYQSSAPLSGLRKAVEDIYGELFTLTAEWAPEHDKRQRPYPVWTRQITNGQRFVVFPPWDSLFYPDGDTSLHGHGFWPDVYLYHKTQDGWIDVREDDPDPEYQRPPFQHEKKPHAPKAFDYGEWKQTLKGGVK